MQRAHLALALLVLAWIATEQGAAAGPAASGCSDVGPAGTLSDAMFADWENVPSTATITQFALVIGNDYDAEGLAVGLAQLRNARNDAAAMAGMLRHKGYAVVCLWDVPSDALYESIWRFTAQWQKVTSPVGLVYFAGHGGETADGTPFIIPADYDTKRWSSNLVDTRLGEGLRAVHLNSLLSFLPELEGTNYIHPIVVIDACRTTAAGALSGAVSAMPAALSPFLNAAHRYAPDENGATYELVYTTANGKPAGDGADGHNGPFVSEILSHLDPVSWDRSVLSPELALFVDEMGAALKNDGYDQRPGGPIAHGRAQSDYLWRHRRDDSEDIYYWDLGYLKREVGANLVDCGPPLGKITALDAHTGTAGWEWTGKAATVYRAAFPTCVSPPGGNSPILAAAAPLPPNRLSVLAAPPARASRLAAMSLDPSIAGAIADRTSGAILHLDGPAKAVQLFQGLRSRLGARLSKLDFERFRFRLECAVMDCSNRRVGVVSSAGAIRGYVRADLLRRTAERSFALRLILPDAVVTQPDSTVLADFLRTSASAATAQVRLTIVQPPDAPLSNDIVPDVLRTAQQLRLGIVSTMDAVHVDVILDRTIRSDLELRSACLAKGIDGPCLVVSLVPLSN